MAKRERSQATGGDAGDAAKGDALAAALLVIERQYGRGAVMRLGGAYAGDADPAISTGSLGLDLACGVGGFPRGRIVEVYGPESSGKTTLALHAVANAQALGGTAAIVDAEHALDPAYARRLGVDLENLLVSQPDSGEQALDIVELLVRSNSVDLIVVDSVAALTPRAELEGAMGDSHMGLQARLMSQALRKLTGAIRKSRAVVIFINQIRMQIGVMFGNPEITPGGRALKFHASLRVDIRRIQTLKKGEESIGIKVRAKVVKNKVAPPFREAQFDILFARGINREGELIDLGSAAGLVQKSGSWFSWNGSRLGQGRDQAALFVKEHRDVADELEQALRAGPAEAAVDGAGAPEEDGPEDGDA